MTTTPWKGRVDASERGDTTRLFSIVQPAAAAAMSGAPVLVGFCCDAGVLRNQGRPGAARGPHEIRRSLANLPAHGLRALFDAGDVECTDDRLEEAQEVLGRKLHALLDAGAFPLVLGGGHEIAWGSWQGLRAHLDARGDAGRVLVLNLDAHFDLRTSRPGSSGTPFDQIAGDCAARGRRFEYLCLGVSRLSNTPALFERAAELGASWVEDTALQERHLDTRLAELQARLDQVDHVYLTIDLDVLQGAAMPAVSAPAAYGLPPTVIEEIIVLVRRSGKLRIADLAEFNPAYDDDSRGARLAARLSYRLLS